MIFKKNNCKNKTAFYSTTELKAICLKKGNDLE